MSGTETARSWTQIGQRVEERAWRCLGGRRDMDAVARNGEENDVEG